MTSININRRINVNFLSNLYKNQLKNGLKTWISDLKLLEENLEKNLFWY